MFHAAAGARVFSGAMLGAHTILMPAFEPLLWLQLVERHCAHTSQFVPTMFSMLLDHPDFGRFDLSSIRLLSYGAAPMPLALLQRAMQAFPEVDFCQGFGMSECGPVVCTLDGPSHRNPPREAVLSSAGRPQPYVEIRIVDENGHDLATGEAGEVLVRGPNVMKGYWNRPEQSADALQGGWYHSGDGGYMDEDGFLFLAGRIKDMIISGGENVYPLEIENLLSLHPAVRECAIIGIPDDKWGESVHAVIRPQPDATVTEADIIAYCRDALAHYKCPRSVSFRDEPMPLTSINKVRKSALREPFWRDAATEAQQ
jgi:acyl-CoA synthetase (AMP-forming)/AMP-acid ligase II